VILKNAGGSFAKLPQQARVLTGMRLIDPQLGLILAVCSWMDGWRRRAREGPKWRTREVGGGSECEPIKILLEGDIDSNKMNTASNTRLRLNYPSWSRLRSH
jgi:hypothetical protein